MAIDMPNKIDLKSSNSLTVSFLAKATFLIGLLSATSLSAMPVNPQRPYTATTCEAATQRLEEALVGNPLISKEEMAEVLTVAREGSMRLCGCDITQENIAKFNTKNIENSK